VRPDDVLKAFQAAGFEKAERTPVIGWFSEYTAVK
jgi:hypothetical protein